MKQEDYFKIVSTDNSVLHLELKRYWTEKEAKDLAPSLLEAVKSGVDSFRGTSFLVLADLSDFGTPNEITRSAIQQCMAYCAKNGLFKTVEVMSKALTKMAVDKTAKETLVDDVRIVVKTLEEGKKKITELQDSLQV